jgi:hypothetical protein
LPVCFDQVIRGTEIIQHWPWPRVTQCRGSKYNGVASSRNTFLLRFNSATIRVLVW